MSRPKRIMRKFRIDEISGVDVPAQEGALVTIMKRDDGSFEKLAMLTTEGDGHQHGIDDRDYQGNPVDFGLTTHARAPGEDHDHAHAWARDEYTMEIDIASNEGHTHEIECEDDEGEEDMGKAAKKKIMPTPEEREAETDNNDGYAEKTVFTADQRKQLADSGAALPDGSFPIRNKEDLHHALRAQGRSTKPSGTVRGHIARRAKALGLEGELPDSFDKMSKTNNGEDMDQELMDKVASLEKKLDEERAYGALNDVEKALYEGMDKIEKRDFLKMSRNDRAAVIKKADEANPIVFTAADGQAFRKNDDPRLVNLAKKNDELAKKANESSALVEAATFAKRASTELGNLPGDEGAKVALLKALGTISDEAVRGKATQLLKAANNSMAKAFQTLGTSEGGSTGDDARPVDQLENLAKRHSEAHKVSIEKARVAVLDTKEGQDLYAKTTARGAGI